MTVFDRLHDRLKGLEVCANVPMRDLTTFKIGGDAALVLSARSADEILLALREAKKLGAAWFVMGNGSNLLVSDEGIDALVIRIGEGMCGMSREGRRIRAAAGVPLTALARYAVDEGLMGLEWAAGIPGTVGGAVAMNAGAYDGEIKNVLCGVDAIIGGEIRHMVPCDADMGYRTSAFSAPGCIVLSAEFLLDEDDGGARARMNEYLAKRREKQPLSLPSAGSTFKRPKGYYAGTLIEEAMLKGARIGGAAVSELHAGFIVNMGGATCADVKSLISFVQQRVLAYSGVMLEPEVKLVGK